MSYMNWLSVGCYFVNVTMQNTIQTTCEAEIKNLVNWQYF